MTPAAVVTESLGRTFKGKREKGSSNREPYVALGDVNLEIGRGELFGLLGPNGAGKTTLIKILCTLLAPTTGRAVISEVDVMKNPQRVRRMINMVSGGENSGYGILTVRENLWMFSQFYGIPTPVAMERIDTLMDLLDLTKDRNTKVGKLSTGMRQKMNFIRGFVNDPDILFLDEPTLGLDVGAARAIRSHVKAWTKSGNAKTVLLTTHYLAEADELCDRLAIIDSGRILACDSPGGLKRALARDTVIKMEVASYITDCSELNTTPGVKRCNATPRPDLGITELVFSIEDDSVLSSVLAQVTRLGHSVASFKKQEPSLEDVFVELVGRRLTDAPASKGKH